MSQVVFKEPTMMNANTESAILSTVRKISSEKKENSDIEIELRLGNYSKTGFVSGVTRNEFFAFKKFLDSKGLPKRQEKSRDIIQNTASRMDNAKVTVVYDDKDNIVKITSILKKNIENYEFKDYGMRLSISKEEKKKIDAIPSYTSYREKNRSIYTILEGEIHLTDVVHSEGTRSNQKWEIELEIDPQRILSVDVIMQNLFKDFHQTPLVFTQNEKLQAIDYLNASLEVKKRFDGSDKKKFLDTIDTRNIPTARNLKKDDMVAGGIIPRGTETEYSVTIKADGVNAFVVLYYESVYIMKPPQSLIKIATMRSPSIGIFQGEYIPTENVTEAASKEFREAQYRFLIFDCITLNRKSLVDEKHMVRLQQAEKFLSMVEISGSSMYMRLKEFSLLPDAQTFYFSVNKILDTVHMFKTDGLIFTPNIRYSFRNSPIPLSSRRLTSHADICKWKPPSMLTMDLEISRSIGDDKKEKLRLLMSGRDRNEFKGSITHPFDIRNLILTDEIKNAHNGTIYEFEVDSSDRLHAIRERSDKTYPNSEEVVLDVWEDIHTPITEGIIRGKEPGLLDIHLKMTRIGLLQRCYTVVGEGKPGLFFGTVSSELSKISEYYPNSVIIEPSEIFEKEYKDIIRRNNLRLTVLNRKYTDLKILDDLKNKTFPLIRAMEVFNILQTDLETGVSSLSTDGKSTAYQRFMTIINSLLTDDGVFASLTLDRNQVYTYLDKYPSMWDHKGVLFSGKEMIIKEVDYEPTKEEEEDFAEVFFLKTKEAKIYEFMGPYGPILGINGQEFQLPDLDKVSGVLEDRGLQSVDNGSIREDPLLTMSDKILLQWYTWAVSKRS